MSAAWLLTAAALAGIAIGMSGRSRRPSALLSAAAGGLLAGICLFWVLPEIASFVGRVAALSLTGAVFAALLILDNTLLEHRQRSELLIPLLIATAIHSFLDGWSVRAFSTGTMSRIAAGLGLGLHKVPEGMAIGWVVRSGIGRSVPALCAAVAVELATPVGAWTEPYAQRSGFIMLGAWSTALVLAVVGGTFLFLGVHAIADERKNVRALATFVVTFAAVGAIAATGVKG